MNRVLVVALVAFVAGCGGNGTACPEGTESHDGDCVAPDGAVPTSCATDEDCTDGLFCNGAERCDPSSESADARGCVSGERPCMGAACVEATATCDESCADADGDGYADAACGGDDCDDSNPRIHPGAVEVCDSAGVDEDCDPSTLGPDRDGDDYVGAECCNLQPDGELLCGTDCDDTMANVHPSAPEVCNGIDDDCDGLTDEGVTTTYYRDLDGDNYGNPDVTIQACSPPAGWTILCCDCNDEDPRVNPAATELCMPPGVDEDCDGAIDEGCDCTFMGSRVCGPGAPYAGVGLCRDGTQTCSAAGTLSDCMGGVFPTVEVCDGLDNDCDGVADEGFDCRQNAMAAGTTSCGRAGVRRCDAACAWIDDTYYAAAETAASCDYCADTLGGFEAERASLVAITPTPPFPAGTQLTAEHRAFGDAYCMPYMGSPCVNVPLHPTGIFSGPDRMGGFYGGHAVQVGYGRVTIAVRMRVTGVSGGGAPESALHPRQGWALTLAQVGSGTSLFSGDVLGLGVPLDRDGWSFEWRYYGGDAVVPSYGPERDTITMRLLNRVGADPVVARVAPIWGFDAEHRSTGLNLHMTLVLTPDDPTTASDETAMTLTYLVEGFPSSMWRCNAPGFPACGRRIRPGDRFDIGVMSTSGGTGGNNRTASTVQEFRVSRENYCP